MTRFLIAALVASAGLTADGWIADAAASVEGESYAVSVRTNFTAPFDDVLTFQADGRLVAASGPAGQWTETTAGPIAQWSGNLTTVQLSGVQIGPLLLGTGHDNYGHMYVLYGRRTQTPPASSQ